jgi:phage recombination protein Bet
MQELQKFESSNIINWECNNQLKTIKDIYGKKLTNEEFGTFVNLGKSTGLNPFLREIWAIKYSDSPASIFVARDGYRKSAQANPNYDYHLVDAVYSNDIFKVVNGEPYHEYKINDRGTLIGAYCIVKRKSSSQPNFVFVDLKEYDQNQSLWKTKKATMIKKVAEAQCLRMAFQELFAGTYSEDEFAPEDNSKEAKNTRAQNKLGNIIDGKSEKILNVGEIMLLISNAKTLTDLESIPNLVKNLSSEDKEIVREFYKETVNIIKLANDVNNDSVNINKETGEIILSNYEKVKKQLLAAKSLDTLQLAADLIREVEEDKQVDLLEIYNDKIEKLK